MIDMSDLSLQLKENFRLWKQAEQQQPTRNVNNVELALTHPENVDLRDFSKSQWYTPAQLARRIAEWALAGLAPVPPSMLRVLEPSAGQGALARPLRELGAHVLCVEIDASNAALLMAAGFSVSHRDFLQPLTVPPVDLAVMNPPFEGGQTERHVMQALRHAPRVVCHCPLTTLAGKGRRDGLWSEVHLRRLVIHSARPNYGGSGGKTDMCTIDVVRRHEGAPSMQGHVTADGCNVEWWD